MSRTRRDLGLMSTIRPGVIGLARAIGLGISLVHAAPLTVLPRDLHDDEPEAEGEALWVLLVIATVLVLLGGAFAGLTIALMGQDSIYLQVISQDHEEPQRKNAKRVHDLLDKGKHWVLVTLLLSNVIVNETLPVVLDRCFGGGVAAVVGSTVMIVIFGEILPQSVCVRYGLQIGGYMSKPVLILMYILSPVAWPTAKLLDWLLGEDHGTVYKKSGLKTLMTLHQSMGEVQERLNEDEVTIISAVLDLKRKPVEAVMTPMDDVFTMSEDTVLDEETMTHISAAGFSRIPIHQIGNPTNFVGMLLVKTLIVYDPEDARKVRDFALATLPETRPETSCLDIINFFQQGKSHMVLISDSPGEDHGCLGVVTLEDVIEELIGEEIIDESDVYVDIHKAIRRAHPAPNARVQRKDLLVKDTAVKDGNLIDMSDNEDARPLSHKRNASLTRRPASPSALSSSPKTTLLMRRSSAGQDGQMVRTTVPVKANYEELRGHFKHLGPSNPASNPKTSKISAVKIKPGIGGKSRSDSVATETIPEHHVDANGVNERTSLLRPDATSADGGHLSLQNYTSPTGSSSGLKPKIVLQPSQDDPDTRTRVLTGDADPGKASPPTPGSVSSLGSLPSQSSGLERSRVKRGYVRSGSITENIVEAGGIRKVVLEATSSGEDGDEDATGSGPVIPLQPRDDNQSDADGSGGTDPSASAPSQGNGKKKQRRKKRKGGK